MPSSWTPEDIQIRQVPVARTSKKPDLRQEAVESYRNVMRLATICLSRIKTCNKSNTMEWLQIHTKAFVVLIPASIHCWPWSSVNYSVIHNRDIKPFCLRTCYVNSTSSLGMDLVGYCTASWEPTLHWHHKKQIATYWTCTHPSDSALDAPGTPRS